MGGGGVGGDDPLSDFKTLEKHGKGFVVASKASSTLQIGGLFSKGPQAVIRAPGLFSTSDNFLYS